MSNHFVGEVLSWFAHHLVAVNLNQCDKYSSWYLIIQIHHSWDQYMLSFIKGHNSKVVNMRTTWVWQIVFEKICINIRCKSIFCTLMHVNYFIIVCWYILEKVLPVKYTYDVTPKLKTEVNVLRLGHGQHLPNKIIIYTLFK